LRLHRIARQILSAVVAAAVLSAGLVVWATPAGAIPVAVPDETWVANGTVYAVTQVGDRLYLGGSFTRVGPNTGFGVRLDPTTGTWITGFPKVNGPVLVTVPDGSGGWFIGGDFSRVGNCGQACSRHNAARIRADGTVSDWNPSPDLPVRAIAPDVAHNTVFIGGDFTTVRGVARGALAATNIFTGAPDPAWNPAAAGGTVNALALSADGSRLYAGGAFTTVGGSARSELAALNAATGALDGAWKPSPGGGAVEALALNGSRLFVGGAFTSVGSSTRNRLAAVDATSGALDSDWKPSANQPVHVLALAAGGSRLYAGGAFTTINGSTRKRLAALSTTGSGGADGTWKPAADLDVSGISLSGDGALLYAAGAFTKIGSTKRNYLAAVSTTGSGALASWNPDAGQPASTVAVSGASVFAGGFFTTVNGAPRANLAALNATTGVLDSGFVADASSTVKALAASADGSKLYVGGLFKTINGSSRSRVAKLDAVTGAVDGSWKPAPNGEVKSLAVGGGRVYAGGAFSSVNGSTRNRLAAFDPANGALASWNPNVSSVVYDVALSPDSSLVYFAGNFSTVGGSTRKRLAAVSASSGSPTSWKPAVKAPLRRVVVAPDGSRVFVGAAGAAGAEGSNRVIAYSTSGSGAQLWQDVADGDVVSLALDGSTLYAGGHFDNVNAVNGAFIRRKLMALDITTGAVQLWGPTVGGPHGVWSLSARNGGLVAGGDFRVMEFTVAQGVARFSAS
jgi:beta-propeller uncharacterized protein DUF5122